MFSTILNGAVIGKGSLVAAGAVVKENMIVRRVVGRISKHELLFLKVPPFSLVAGVPAKVVKQDPALHERCKRNAAQYLKLKDSYIKYEF
jgi:carbonic anhydrase/acetyltransferase-like protein (isoleucine patch superfamily)